MHRRRVWLGLVALMALACAVSVPPTGGPEDTAPPTVTQSVPAPDSAGVDPATAIQLTFSEPMWRAGLDRNLKFSPNIEYGRVSWNDQTLVVEPANGLHPDTTYVVTLEPGYRDAHNVPAKQRFHLAFATSAVLDTARIEGTIYFRREPTATGIVRCFRLPRDSAFSAEAAKPDREARTDTKGAYALNYLSPRGDAYLVWAFEDKNKNGTFEPASEYGMAFADTIRLSATSPVAAGVDIAIIDPNEPGSIAGRVDNTSGIDSIGVTVTLATAVDTVLARYLTKTAERGSYGFENVPPGTYALVAFVDVRTDSMCGSFPCPEDTTLACLEPCVSLADSLVVAPGARVDVPLLTLPPAVKENE